MFVFIPRYKIPVMIALATGLVYIAMSAESNWLMAVLAFVGALLSIFVLDLEYIFHVYFIDPQHEKAEDIKAMLKGKKFLALADYFSKNEYSFGELSIRSVLFQIILAIFTFYLVVTNSFVLVTCLCLSLMGNLLYEQLLELNETKTLERWFWVYDGDLTARVYQLYLGAIFLALLISFYYI